MKGARPVEHVRTPYILHGLSGNTIEYGVFTAHGREGTSIPDRKIDQLR